MTHLPAHSIAPALKQAWTRRAELHARADTNAYRLLNRAADGFPTLTVDRYAEVLVANVYSAGQTSTPPIDILEACQKRAQARAVYVKYRPAQANMLSEAERQALAPPAPVLGESVLETTIRENGLQYSIQPGNGLSVGLFLDMREVRQWVQKNAHKQTVLNCFAYTCGFGLAAMLGGATRAVNVDAARAVLDWGQRNYSLNTLTPDPHDFISGDVFDWLNRFRRTGQTFGMVILDPPSYATTKKSRFAVSRDYAELAALAMQCVAPGGTLLACANARELPEKTFKMHLQKGLADTKARFVRQLHEPSVDFPVAPGEKPYLKVWVIGKG